MSDGAFSFNKSGAGDGASRRDPRDRTRKPSRSRCQPELESLEGRRLLAASLAALPNVSVPDYQGYQVPLNGSGSNATTQSYTVTSSNPDIGASVATGEFLTLNVSHASSGTGDVAIPASNVVIQLFGDLTPNTVANIESFVQQGFYNNKNLFRVANNFPNSTGYIIQGGSANNQANGVSGLPGTPFNNEIVQQLGFNNEGQLAMANSGKQGTNDTQFFFTSGTPNNTSYTPPNSLSYQYTIFGQVVSGLNVVQQMTQVTTTTDPVLGGQTMPVSPIVINSATLSTTNPNGVVHIDATQARVGETSTITVTATDPATKTTATQAFNVTVTANGASYFQVGGTTPFVLRPIAFANTIVYKQDTPQTIQLSGDPANAGQTLTYNIVSQPTNGTISQFNSSTGTLVYTPNPGFQGADSFQFTVTNSGGLTSDARSVTLATSVIPPTAADVNVTNNYSEPMSIQLQGSNPNPGYTQSLNYQFTSNPTKGTISQLNSATGQLVYTPNVGATGTDSFTYNVTSVGPPFPGLVSQTATVTINLNNPAVNTGAVRVITNPSLGDSVLTVTPPPGAPNGKNNVLITETQNPLDPTQNKILVIVNGHADINQPLASSITSIVGFGGKASNTITVDPSVDPLIGVTIDGGHGRHAVNVLQGGDGTTVEHGWFGRKNTLIGGTGTNILIGRAGKVKFQPSSSTSVIFAGVPKGTILQGHHDQTQANNRLKPPGGTFYRVNSKGRLVAIPTPRLTADLQDARVSTAGGSVAGGSYGSAVSGTGSGTTRKTRKK